MLKVWLKRLLLSPRHFLKLEAVISLLGLTLAVMCVTITLIIMSSYEATLKNTLISRTGHLVLFNRGKTVSSLELEKKIQSFSDQVKASSTFVSMEALALSLGETAGVLVEGLPLSQSVLDFQSQLIDGQLIKNPYSASLGKDLASKLKLKVGSSFYIAVPQEGSSPRLQKLSVSGILDLGRYDFNSRYITISLPLAQKILDLKNKEVTGIRVLMNSEKDIQPLVSQLASHTNYEVRDWKSINKNLFFAIKKEKTIIFFILLILIISASFNISNQFSLQVMKRFKDIGILKAMGTSKSTIAQLFLSQAIVLGFLGLILGFSLAIGLCYYLTSYNVWGSFIPSNIYELNHIILKLNILDFILISIFTMVICLLSVWLPIKKAVRLIPYEGLRFD